MKYQQQDGKWNMRKVFEVNELIMYSNAFNRSCVP